MRIRIIWPEKVELYKVLAICSMLLNVGMLGGALNLWVVSVNGGRMPVHEMYIPSDYKDTHFTFYDFSQVDYPLLSDIIRVKGTAISIGDFLMIGSLGVMLLIWGRSTVKSIKQWWGNRKCT